MFQVGEIVLKERKTKGKRLNIVDILVLLLLAAIVVFLVIRGIGLYRAAQVLEVESAERNENARLMPEDFKPNLRVVLVCRQVENSEAERIGQAEFRRLYNNYSLLNAYVSDIQIQPSVLHTVNAAGKELETKSDVLSDIVFTVDAQVDLANPDSVIDGNFNPLIGNQELRIGKQYILKTMELEITATVTDMEILYAVE